MTIQLLEKWSNMKLLSITKRMIAGNISLHQKLLFEYEIIYGKVTVKIFGSSTKNKFLYERKFRLQTKQRKPIPGNRLYRPSKTKRAYGQRSKNKKGISEKPKINKWITEDIYNNILQIS